MPNGVCVCTALVARERYFWTLEWINIRKIAQRL